MPFEDLTGNSGFTSDSEGANANLDITMSDESARNLWDVQAAIQQIAVDFQTAVRSAADFQSYLISIRETGQTIQMPSLGMEGGEGGNMSYSGGRVDTGSVPIGVQSEGGMAGRVAEMEENSSGAGGGLMGSRAPAGAGGTDPGEFISQVTNTAWMASMGLGQHNNQIANEAYGQAYRFAQGNPLSPQVLGSTFGGQAGTPHAYAASQLISQAVSGSQQFLRGGGVGGFAGSIGRLGMYGAIGYTGYQVGNAVLEQYAQARAMGISANNSDYGTGWGFGQNVGRAGMALSPFVSSEEATQIYEAAVSQGWASRKGGFDQGNFGQAVNFMYDAAKDYNMDPSMSAQLLQTNALGAGQSINALSQQLLTLKQTLDGTGVSMDSANTSFASFTSFLISAGANPDVASQIAGGALKGYAGNTLLGPTGMGAGIAQATLQSTQAQNILAGLTGTLPGAVLAGSHGLEATSELQKMTSRLANQILGMSGLDAEEKAAMFQQSYNAMWGVTITPQQASDMMAENAANPTLLTQGQRDYLDKSKMGPLEHQNAIQSWWHGLDDTGGWAASQTGHARTTEQMEKASALINSYQNYSPEVNALLSSSGDLSKVILYGPDGKPVMDEGKRVAGANIAKWFSDTSNYNKFTASGSGYYIEDESGARYNSMNIGVGGSGGAQQDVSGSSDARTIYITLSPQAKQWFDTNKDKLHLSDGKN
ncbi:MAG TPA: hypothetical protein VIY48_11880 [Candidatus Paceibacterota bacterium]